MRKLYCALCELWSVAVFAAAPTITGVTAQQRYPWNGKVDISYTVTGDIAIAASERGMVSPSLVVTARDQIADNTYTATAAAMSGDMGLSEGRHSIVWDMSADGLTFKSTNVVFIVAFKVKPAPLANEDVVIESIAPSAVAGAFDLVVRISDVEIGADARLVETLGVEGTAELHESAFSSDGFTVTLERTSDGKAKATVAPDGMPPSFFLRVKVK